MSNPFNTVANSNKHIKSVVVFCGSRSGNLPMFEQEAWQLGRGLAENGYELIYGSGTVGLMGAVSDAAQEAGGQIHGINVHMFAEAQGVAREGVRETITETMFERKAQMLNESQASICLPGGIGTLDEAGEVLVENDIMEHHNPNSFVKPVILISPEMPNGRKYYDPFLEQLQMCLSAGFTNAHIGRYYIDVPNAAAAVDVLNKLNEQGPVPISEYRSGLLPENDQYDVVAANLN